MKQDVKRYCNSDCTTEEQFLGIACFPFLCFYLSGKKSEKAETLILIYISELAPKKLFYFISFNMLCVTDEDVYIPVEVGIVEYSIQYGIHRQYTKIIYPGMFLFF